MKAGIVGASALLLSLGLAPTQALNVNGGAVTSMFASASDDPTPAAPLAFAVVPGAGRTINIPAGADTIIVTFTAECILFGNTDPSVNWVELEIRDNNVPILPTNDGGSPLALCSDTNYASHAVQVVKRLTAGSHVIRVYYRVEKGNDDNLAGYLDDWSFTILQAN
jgi:hypothetical protein